MVNICHCLFAQTHRIYTSELLYKLWTLGDYDVSIYNRFITSKNRFVGDVNKGGCACAGVEVI